MPADADIQIRDCVSLEDFQQCVALQKAVWGFEDRDLVPVRFFVVAHKIEGQVLGAFEPSGRLAGFCLAVPALKGSHVYLHSHMLAVAPDCRHQGLGRNLKLEQRREALARGIGLVEWTFDPFELKNARLNLERLGAIVRRYVPNQYGLTSSPLQQGLPTDRLVAEWWLASPRVAALAKGEPAPRGEVLRRIEVPLAVAQGRGQKPNEAAEFQRQMARQFQEAFAAGLTVIGFEASETVGLYLLGVEAPE